MGWGWDYVQELASKAEHHDGGVVRGAEHAWDGTAEGFEQAGTRLEDHLMAAAAARPQGTNGHEIYLMFHGPQVKGTSSIDSSVAGWHEVFGYQQQAGDALQSATSKLGLAWQGAAADSAGAGVTPLREAADLASRQAMQAGTALETQSSWWNDTAHKVTDVPADPPRMSLAQVDPISPVPAQPEPVAYTAAQQANQQALSGYGSATSTNTQQIPQFMAPAPADSTQPGGPHGGAVAGGVSSPAPGIPETVHSGHSAGDSPNSSTVDGSPQPATTHSAWQMQDVMPHPDGGQATPQQNAIPVAGAAAGAAGLIAGGSALMGASGAVVGGSSIGARLAGGGLASGLGSSAAGRATGDMSGTGGYADEAEAASRGAGARGGKEHDEEHHAPDYLVEANPYHAFGQRRQVSPPVFGEAPEPVDIPAEGE